MGEFMTPSDRSLHMAKIRSKDTKPELSVRKSLHALGYRYKLHDKHLPGKPDLVFPRRKKVIFVNGCFWHGHNCPVGSRLPKTNREFWAEKRRANRERDAAQRRALEEAGWKYLDVWECHLQSDPRLLDVMCAFLEDSN